MTDPAGAPPPESQTCPWCSSPVSAEAATCPACGAVLREEADVEIPGVTQVDPTAAAMHEPPGTGGSLIGWLSGEYVPEPTKAELASVEPPSEAVQREILKLEVDALRAEIEAREAELETEALEARTGPQAEASTRGDQPAP